eukprot:scaffold7803_cov350-Prasinococcus_capsulatus_cf.AAC.1
MIHRILLDAPAELVSETYAKVGRIELPASRQEVSGPLVTFHTKEMKTLKKSATPQGLASRAPRAYLDSQVFGLQRRKVVQTNPNLRSFKLQSL